MCKDMNNLILVTPTKEHESQVMEFREEMLKNGEGFYGCSGLNGVSGYGWIYAKYIRISTDVLLRQRLLIKECR